MVISAHCLAGFGVDTMLSRQTMLNCGAFDNYGGGCDGGDVIDVRVKHHLF